MTAHFYAAKKWIGIERSIDKVVKKHHDEKIPKPFPSRINGPCTKWQTYFRQQDAFEACRGVAKDLHVFAFESDSFEGNTGQRLYLTTSYPVFWHFYRQMDSIKRHHYEVIPQGCVSKLYFDLEFDRLVNPGRDGDGMVNLLINIMCTALEKEFSLKCLRSDVLDMEASTEKKFSRHLIFQTGQTVFKNNVHAGNFVTFIMSGILEKVEKSRNKGRCDSVPPQNIANEGSHESKIPDNSEIECTNTKNEGSCEKSGKEGSTNDTYSDDIDVSNKHFSNNKMGSVTAVDLEDGRVIAETEDKSSVDRATEDRLEEILRSFTAEELGQMIVKNKHGEDVLFCDTGVYTKNRNFRLYLSSKLNKNNTLMLSAHNTYRPTCTPNTNSRDEDESIFYDSLVSNIVYTNRTRVLMFGDDEEKRMTLSRGHKAKSGIKEDTIDGYNKSPYPEVDEYITGQITQNSHRGSIRHWTYFNLGELLLYEISHYRFCHNIGRPHRSNNIMFIVDLRRGVFYQKCHDPDCHMQNYKSDEWILPRHILPDSYFDDSDMEEEMDDQELLNTTLELEQQLSTAQGHRNNTHNLDMLDDGNDDYLLDAAKQIENG